MLVLTKSLFALMIGFIISTIFGVILIPLLKKIKAGATFSASLINALVRGINSFLDVGRYFGSSIRRFIGGNSCPLK